MIDTIESRQLTDREISQRFNAKTRADNERRRQLGIDAILRAEVDELVAKADDTPERNPRTSRWSEHQMDWTWAFIARPVFTRGSSPLAISQVGITHDSGDSGIPPG